MFGAVTYDFIYDIDYLNESNESIMTIYHTMREIWTEEKRRKNEKKNEWVLLQEKSAERKLNKNKRRKKHLTKHTSIN